MNNTVKESRIVESLVLDLLGWLAERPRIYEEVMEAWRTSCPRLTVWEDASDRGLVETADSEERSIVKITPAGRMLLQQRETRID